MNGLKVAKQKSYVVNLTDAGPGVGVTNHEVCYRLTQEIRIAHHQYYIRHHLAPADGSHNDFKIGKEYIELSKCQYERCKCCSVEGVALINPVKRVP